MFPGDVSGHVYQDHHELWIAKQPEIREAYH